MLSILDINLVIIQGTLIILEYRRVCLFYVVLMKGIYLKRISNKELQEYWYSREVILYGDNCFATLMQEVAKYIY